MVHIFDDFAEYCITIADCRLADWFEIPIPRLRNVSTKDLLLEASCPFQQCKLSPPHYVVGCTYFRKYSYPAKLLFSGNSWANISDMY